MKNRQTSIDEAKNAALADAGLQESDVTSSFVNKDFDDDRGVTTYDVEFHVGAQEYNYDIDVTTGEIYEFDSEMDDWLDRIHYKREPKKLPH